MRKCLVLGSDKKKHPFDTFIFSRALNPRGKEQTEATSTEMGLRGQSCRALNSFSQAQARILASCQPSQLSLATAGYDSPTTILW